jgi:hypothetical protein
MPGILPDQPNRTKDRSRTTVPAKKIVVPDGLCEICLTLGAGRVLARIPRLADKPATQSVAGRAGLDGIRETTPPRRAAKERS